MPKRKVNRTMRARGKGRRDAAVRSMASSSIRGATSIANSTFKRPMRRGRKSRLKKDKYLIKGAESLAKSLGSVSKMAYDTSMPMIEEAGRSVGKSLYKMIRENKVPIVPNMGAWVDLRYGLITGLTNLSVIESDSELPTTVYFQSIKKFLDDHSDVMFYSDDIRSVTDKVNAMDPDDDGDVRTKKMPDIFKNGITHDSIISALEYEFRKKIKSSTDDMDIEPEPEPGQGFQSAKEKTSIRNKYSEILALSKSIGIMIDGRNTLKPNNPQYMHLQSAIDKQYKILKAKAITQQEKKVLAIIDAKLGKSSSMASKKKKSKRRKGKKSGRKRTGRR